jgi:hypothetical protein
MTCNHNWSRETYEGQEYYCHDCNEWQIEVNYDRALAEVERLRLERDEARRELGEILAVIHRDGGHYTGERGLSQSVADAHATWASVVRERDEARAEIERLRAECDKASAMERHRIAEWMMRQAAIEASHGGLHGAVARSVLVALANAVLSGGHAE